MKNFFLSVVTSLRRKTTVNPQELRRGDMMFHPTEREWFFVKGIRAPRTNTDKVMLLVRNCITLENYQYYLSQHEFVTRIR